MYMAIEAFGLLVVILTTIHMLEHLACYRVFSWCSKITSEFELANINSVNPFNIITCNLYRFLCGPAMICSPGPFLKGLLFNKSLNFCHSGTNTLFYFYSMLTFFNT